MEEDEISFKERELMRNIFVSTGGIGHGRTKKEYSHLRYEPVFYHISDNTLTFIKRQFPHQFEDFLRLWGTYVSARPTLKQMRFRNKLIQKTRNFKGSFSKQVTPTIELCLLIYVGLGPKLVRKFSGIPNRIPKRDIITMVKYPGQYKKR